MTRTSFLVAWNFLAVLAAAPALAQSNASSPAANFKLSNDQPVDIQSDRLEINQEKSTAVFTGNVVVVQGDTRLSAGTMVVHYKASGDGKASVQGASEIDRLEVSDNIVITAGVQKATGDKGDFDMKSNVLKLTGKKIELSDGANILTGCSLDVAMDTGHVKVGRCPGERVTTKIDPTSDQNKPKK